MLPAAYGPIYSHCASRPPSMSPLRQSPRAAAMVSITKCPKADGRRLIDYSGLRVHPTTTSDHHTRKLRSQGLRELTGRD
jgi:hypothetical protein